MDEKPVPDEKAVEDLKDITAAETATTTVDATTAKGSSPPPLPPAVESKDSEKLEMEAGNSPSTKLTETSDRFKKAKDLAANYKEIMRSMPTMVSKA